MAPQINDQSIPPRAPHLRLEPTMSHHTLLDGCWWRRSADPVAELPGLVLALDHLHGPVNRLHLSAAGWSRRPHGVEVAGRPIGLGYFSDQPDWLLVANCADGRSVAIMIAPQVAPDQDAGDGHEASETEGGHLSIVR